LMDLLGRKRSNLEAHQNTTCPLSGVKRTSSVFLSAISLRQCRPVRRRIAKPPLVLGSSIFMSSRFDALASISAACWLIYLCDLRRMELGDCSGLIEPDLNVCAVDLNHFAVAITKYPTVRPWMKLNALAHHISGPWLGFGCHRRAPAGMTVNTVNTPRSQIAKLICESTCSRSVTR